MKFLAQIVPVLILSVFACRLCNSQEELINNAVNSECMIPNQMKTRGICVQRKDCSDYENLFDVPELTTERLSFIMNLDCGFDFTTWNSLICCPTTGNSYKKPDLVVDPQNMKVRDPLNGAGLNETNLDNRFSGTPSNPSNSALAKKRKCGVQGFMQRIFGGEICEIDEFPWAALLLYESKSTNLTMNACGGVLLNKKFVLTAGHCVKGEALEKALTLKYVRMGEYDITNDTDCIQELNGQLDCTDPPVDYVIESIIPHPLYNPNNPSKHHDLAILRLSETVKYTDFIQPICLPTKEFNKGLENGKPQMVTGWGKTDLFKQKYGGRIVQSPIKLKVSLPYVEKANCTKKYAEGNIRLSPSQICAGGMKAKDSCSGDSGSPLMYYDSKKFQWVLTGIVSFGQKICGLEGFPAVYVNVTNYLEWIEKTISDGDEEETINFS